MRDLGDMLPRSTGNDLCDCRQAYAVFQCKIGVTILTCAVVATDISDRILSELSRWVVFPLARRWIDVTWVRLGVLSESPLCTFHSTLSLTHLGHVLIMGPEVKMPRVDARRVVAGVEDEEAIRNSAVGKFPTHPVSVNRLAGPGGANLAVAPRVTRGNPLPAIIGTSLAHLRPEPSCKIRLRSGLGNMLAVPATEATLPAKEPGGRKVESLTADFTGAVRVKLVGHVDLQYRYDAPPVVPATRGLCCA